MKEIALQIASEAKDQKLNTLREYLHNYILFLMQKARMSSSLYFVGGTALRFLYSIRRYSEVLDFSAGEGWSPSDFPLHIKKIKSDLEKAGYSFTLHIKEEKTVQRAMIRFSEILYEVGLTRQKDRKLPIHIEVDINPPTGWQGEKTIVDVYLPVLLQHYDLHSMFAAKLATVLTRPYTKGRDLYDIFWFRSKWKEMLPNYRLLNNAIGQKQDDFTRLNEDNWHEIMHKKIQSLKWKDVENDVSPFLELRDDLLTFTKENLLLLFSH